MSNHISSQSKDSFAFWRELQSYLKTEMEIGAPELVKGKYREYEAVKAKVKVCNIAPDNTDVPTIVFTGVGLGIVKLRPRDTNLPKWARQLERHKVNAPSPQGKPWLQPIYLRATGEQFPKITSDERRHGDILFPGEAIIYELTIPSQEIADIKFCVEGTVSRRHLFHHRKMLAMPGT